MIPFRAPDLPKGISIHDLPPVRTAIRAYTEFVERTFMDAIVRHLGRVPTEDECRKHGQIFCTPDGRRHLCWLDEPPVVGEHWPVEKCIASVGPMYPNRITP